MVKCRVLLLDGTEFACDVNRSAKGEEVFEKVCHHLSIANNEKEYFACSFKDEKRTRFWLSNEKRISRQLPGNVWMLSFEVKFYPSDPSQLLEEQSRYQLFLQLRQDVMSGRLPCSFVTHALLGSYAVQSLFGDYDSREHGTGTQYFSHVNFAPQQSAELLEQIAEMHKTHRGLSPAEAELRYLMNANKLALYGVDLHVAKDNCNRTVEIGVSSVGLLLYQDRLRVNRFMWPKIIKFSYKWNTFTIKVRPGESDKSAVSYEFKLSSDKMAKRLWKIAVEHHTFFRLREPDVPASDLVSRLASKYRYSGRTQYQVQLASSLSASATLDRSANATLDRSTNASLASSRKYTGASKSLDNVVMAGYSTERSESYAADTQQTATLDLKHRRRHNLTSPTPTYDSAGCYSPDMMRSPLDPSASLYGNVLSADEHSRLLLTPGAGGYAQYPDIHGTGQYYGTMPPHWNGTSSPMSGVDQLPAFQDDHVSEQHRRSAGVRGHGSWGHESSAPVQAHYHYYPGTGSHGSPIISEQSYGNVAMTSYNGYHDYDGVDHDKALTQAILAVTSVNNDLSVEKIEIVHNKTGAQ